MPDLDPNELIAEAEAAEETKTDAPEPDATTDEPGDSDTPTGDAEGGGSGDDDVSDSGTPDPEPEPQPVAKAEPEAKKPEIDLDQYKLEDIPDDYTPKNWKEALALAEDRAYKRVRGEDAKKAKKDADDDEERSAAIKEIQSGYDAELASLETEGRIPKGDDGLKRQDQVWQFMNTENAKRQQAGSKFFINSFEDALDKLEAREMKAAQAERDTKEAEARKKRGAMIGGTGGAKVPAQSATGLRKGMSMDDVLEQEGY